MKFGWIFLLHNWWNFQSNPDPINHNPQVSLHQQVAEGRFSPGKKFTDNCFYWAVIPANEHLDLYNLLLRHRMQRSNQFKSAFQTSRDLLSARSTQIETSSSLHPPGSAIDLPNDISVQPPHWSPFTGTDVELLALITLHASASALEMYHLLV